MVYKSKEVDYMHHGIIAGRETIRFIRRLIREEDLTREQAGKIIENMVNLAFKQEVGDG